MLKEFKEFIFTGNVIDFAIAVILAGAVGLVVNGFVADIIMPIVGHFAGGVDFADMMYKLGDEVNEDGSAKNAIRYGKWINSIVNLLIVGWVLFMLGKAKIKFMGAAPAPGPTDDQALLAEIRDALKK
ncbi:UNVERIFIED_CONTAM: hypothetical protein GTU68_067062 [Idotea baltica]|nr:hypothetical protein [Idotea baltica]